MLIENDEKYIPQLRSLWHNVFGDEYGYIDLFFKGMYKSCKTFAHFDDEKIVSVFYLLDCKINFDGNIYNGFYLYAAATDPLYRKRGLMSSLISEAANFAKEKDIDFISLVPGNEPLYSYYSKCGFYTAMYKFIDEYNSFDGLKPDIKRTDCDNYEKIRSNSCCNAFLWNKRELSYVFDCFKYYDTFAFENGYSIFIASKEHAEVKELICKADTLQTNIQQICAMLGCKKITVHSQFGKNKIPFGMIMPINKNLKRQWSFDDIYMNLALD